MKKKYLNPAALGAPPRFYSHIVTVQGGATLAYVSGQVSYGRDGGVVGKGDMRAQSEQVFANVTHALKAAGAGWGDVIKMNGYMVGMNPAAVDAYREVRSRFLKPEQLPASTLVGVTGLVHPDLLLEVEVIASISLRGNTPRKTKKKR